MSQDFTQDELNTLADLLVISQKAKAREALCIKIGINYYRELGFIYGSSEDSFAINLVNHLNEVGNTKAICQLCCQELSSIFHRERESLFLKKIALKLDCNHCNKISEQPSSPMPSPVSLEFGVNNSNLLDKPKSESLFTKIGTVNKKLLTIGAILLGVAGFAINGQISQTVDSSNGSTLSEVEPKTQQNLLANEWFNKGKKLEDAARYEEAIKAFRNAIKSNDSSQQFCLMCAYKHKGDSEFKLNQIDEGIASYELAAQVARQQERENDAKWFENEIKKRRQ